MSSEICKVLNAGEAPKDGRFLFHPGAQAGPRIAAPSWLSIGTPAFAVIAFLRRWRDRAQQINPKQQQPRTHPSRINPIAPPTIGAARRLIICRHIVASSQRWLPTFAATQLVAEHCAGAPDADGWTYVSAILREDFGWAFEPNGTMPSAAEMKAALALASAVEIRGDAYVYGAAGSGQEVVYLNDVQLYAPARRPGAYWR